MTEDTDRQQLKKLILDEDFTSLQNLVNEEVNLMDILRVSHKELQHSNFLAWFFDPSQTHNLGDFALKEFIKIYFRNNNFEDLGVEAGLSVFDFALLDLSDLEIRREYKNIDLIFLSKKNELCIVIENKIYSSESEGQLKKYRNIIENEYPNFKHKIYIFLSLYDQEISESEQDYYVQLNYGHIIELIEQIISSNQLKLPDKTKFVFEQYLQALKSMTNDNKEIKEITQQLYRKYKGAFELVYKYARPDTETIEISNKLEELIRISKDLISDSRSNKTYVKFIPNFIAENIEALRNKELFPPKDNLKDNLIYLFEFCVRDRVTFNLKIGEGHQPTREKLYEVYKKHPIFNKVNRAKQLAAKWHTVFSKEILSQKEVKDYSDSGMTAEELEETIKTKFEELLEKDLPRLLEPLKQELNLLNNPSQMTSVC